MFFLIRTAFWFSLVLLFLPIWPKGEASGARQVGAFEAISAAQRTISDMSRFCEREPQVCETGAAAAETISVRARETARMAGDMLEERAAASGEPTDIEQIIDPARPPAAVGAAEPVMPQTAIIPTPRPVH